MSTLSEFNGSYHQKGFTLIELVVVLIVISVLTVFAMASKPKLMDMVHGYQLKSQLRDIAIGVSAAKGPINNYSGIGSLDKLCKQRVLASSVCNGDQVINNPYGGQYIFAPGVGKFPGDSSNFYYIAVKSAEGVEIPSAVKTELQSIGELSDERPDYFVIEME